MPAKTQYRPKLQAKFQLLIKAIEINKLYSTKPDGDASNEKTSITAQYGIAEML